MMPRKIWIVLVVVGAVAIIGLFSNSVFGLGCSSTITSGWKNAMMGDMMSGMMSDSPQDVTIKIMSSQQVSVGKGSQVVFLILDKKGQPMTHAQVSLALEEGAPMSSMNMIGSMFNAKELGQGKYVAEFTLYNPGYYTLHVHVIPEGKSMHYMMRNHIDVGIIAKT